MIINVFAKTSGYHSKPNSLHPNIKESNTAPLPLNLASLSTREKILPPTIHHKEVCLDQTLRHHHDLRRHTHSLRVLQPRSFVRNYAHLVMQEEVERLQLELPNTLAMYKQAVQQYADIDIFTTNFRPLKGTLSGL
ncbi:Glutathione reductase [Spatholobus suberectus]|nr:Glutathione reductase [Spatholobus suberectus]